MFKLIKWSLIGVITLGAASYVVLGDNFGSYFTTIGSSVRDSVRGTIPVDFELKRAEKLIRAIDPEIRECKRQVAEAAVELETLVAEVKRLEKTVATQRAKIHAGRKLLSQDAETSSYTLSGRDFSRNRIEIDLSRTFELYKNNEAMLRTKQTLIERQTVAVSASQTKLDAVRARKAELEDQISQLKTQKQHLDAMAASNHRFDLDDSKLSQATKVLADVKKRLDVTQKMIEDDMFFTDGIGGEQKPRRDILREIDQHFAGTAPAKKELSTRTPMTIEIGRSR